MLFFQRRAGCHSGEMSLAKIMSNTLMSAHYYSTTAPDMTLIVTLDAHVCLLKFVSSLVSIHRCRVTLMQTGFCSNFVFVP
jgi:hypothetical protein